MSSLIKKTQTNWGEQTLLNTDSGLYITGTKQIAIDANANIALSSWTICFDVTKKTASSNTYFTQSGGITIDDTVLTDLVLDIKTFIAVTSATDLYYNASGKTNISALGNLLNAGTTIGQGDFVISHLQVFDKVLTDVEIDTIKRHVGTTPYLLYDNVKAYYPTTQNYCRKIIAGDTSSGLNGLVNTDRAIWDCVQMFNIGKATVLTPTHGKAATFTDIELGTANPSSQTAFKNFYDDDLELRNDYLAFTSTSQELTFATNANWDSLSYEGTATLSLDISGKKITCSVIGSAYNIEIKNSGGTVLTRLNPNVKSGTTIKDSLAVNDATLVNWSATQTKTGGGAFLELKSNMPRLNQALRIQDLEYVSYDTSNLPDNTEDFTIVSLIKCKDNTSPSPLGTSNHSQFSCFLGDNSVRSDWGLALALHMEYGVRSATTLTNNRFLSIGRPTNGGGVSIIDLSTGHQYGNFDLMVYTRTGSVGRFYTNGVETTKTTVTPINFSTIGGKLFRTGYLNFESSATKSVVAELNLTAFGYWQRALRPWEIAALYNNSLLSNPYAWTTSQSDGFQDKCVLWHQFNEGSIYWDGANYRVTNQSTDVLAGADATLGGYTTGSADFLTDNANSLDDINKLR
jgi:hypothetical protein